MKENKFFTYHIHIPDYMWGSWYRSGIVVAESIEKARELLNNRYSYPEDFCEPSEVCFEIVPLEQYSGVIEQHRNYEED